MNWIEIIGAIGIGAVITKVLDIFWLQKIMEQSEERKWLRDNRFKAFSKLSKELLSFRLYEDVHGYENPFELCAIAAESMLLIEDNKIKNRIDKFIVSLDELLHEKEASDEILKPKYDKIVIESRAIVDLLSSLLIKNKQKDWIKRLFKR